MKKLKIFHFSDSHTYHNLLTVPECDIVIFSGDCSNPRDPYTNEWEVRAFIEWFKEIPVEHKIFVAGNHDTSIEKGLVTKEDFSKHNIHYLENTWVNIEGIKIYGSPHTPQFGQWAFMKDRSKLDEVWKHIPDDIDILVVHGPPKGILDSSRKYYGKTEEGRYYGEIIEFCGCQSLKRHVLERVKPKLMCFGHLHNNDDIVNAGILYRNGTYFSNASIVTDGRFGKLSSYGNLFSIDENKEINILKN